MGWMIFFSGLLTMRSLIWHAIMFIINYVWCTNTTIMCLLRSSLPVAHKWLTIVKLSSAPSSVHGNITLWNGTLSFAIKLYISTWNIIVHILDDHRYSKNAKHLWLRQLLTFKKYYIYLFEQQVCVCHYVTSRFRGPRVNLWTYVIWSSIQFFVRSSINICSTLHVQKNKSYPIYWR